MSYYSSQRFTRYKTIVLIAMLVAGALIAASALAMSCLPFAVIILYALSHSSGTGPFAYIAISSIIAYIVSVSIIVYNISSKITTLQIDGFDNFAKEIPCTKVKGNSQDALKQRLSNISEEISIAAGTSVPDLYVMPSEESINAFAACNYRNVMIIAVTQGALELLNRDELQGMVAHEYSHILNEDVTINMRLTGYIQGITILSSFGNAIMGEEHERGILQKITDIRKNSVRYLLGGILYAFGILSEIWGKLIQTSICRQREFLADAAAVHFTRNPSGMAGVLKKIGGQNISSRIHHTLGAQMNHMFISSTATSIWDIILDPHPPLVERIKRIDPTWQGEFPEVSDVIRMSVLEEAIKEIGGLSAAESKQPTQHTLPRHKRALRRKRPRITERHPDPAFGDTKLLRKANQEFARQLIRSIPEEVRDATWQSATAKCVIFALLILHDPQQRQKLTDLLERLTNQPTHDETLELLCLMEDMDPRARLPLMDLCIPPLREMNHEEYEEFLRIMNGLIAGDKHVDLMEWALSGIVKRRLTPYFHLRDTPRTKRSLKLKNVLDECALILSLVAHMGRKDSDAIENAYAAGAKLIGLAQPCLPLVQELRHADEALKKLATLNPTDTNRLLTACAKVISFDNEVTVNQGEFLRVIADSLGCPMPPLLPGQPLVAMPEEDTA